MSPVLTGLLVALAMSITLAIVGLIAAKTSLISRFAK